MIQFDSLKVQGGLSFRDTTLFPLKNQGLTKIIGENLDDTGSNGSGKSSIGELLTHVLYATTAKGLKKNEIICDMHEKGGYSADLSFTSGSTAYRVLQSRSHPKDGTAVKLFMDGKDQAIKGLNEAQDAVKRALGLSFEEWHATTYLSQKMDHLFIRSKENDAKKTMLANIFSLNYQQMREEADAKLKETRVALVALKSNISASKATLEQTLMELGNPQESELVDKIEKDLAELKAMTWRGTQLQEQLSAYMNYKITLAKVDNYKKLLSQQATELSLSGNAPNTIEQCQETVNAIELHILQLEEGLRNTQAHSKYYRDLIPHIENRDRMKESFVPYESWPIELKEMGDRETRLQKLQGGLAKLQATYGDCSGFDTYANLLNTEPENVFQEDGTAQMDLEIYLRGENNSIQAKIGELESHLVSSRAGKCQSCGQDVSPDHLQKLEVEIQAKRTELLEVQKKIVEIQALRDSYQKKEKAHKEWVQKIERLSVFRETTEGEVVAERNTLSEQVTLLKAEIQKVREFQQAYQALQPYLGVEGEVQAVRDHLLTLEATEKSYQDHLPRFRNYLNTLREFAKLDLTPAEEMDELVTKNQISTIQQRSIEISGEISGKKKDLETVRNVNSQLLAIKGKEDEILKLEQSEQIYEGLSYSFGPKGLIVERLGTICEYMNEKANYFISKIMKDNIQLKFGMDGDSIDLDILMNGKTRGTGNLSGGEGSKVGLACMLGLRSLIPDKNQTNLLMLDEVESYFDDRTRFELMDLLKSTIENTSIDTILMVSHSQALQDSMEWDSSWKVSKKDGCSTLQIF